MDELELKELVDVVFKTLGTCKLIDISLWVCVRHYGKTYQQLSDQTAISPADIALRVEYVDKQLQRKVQAYIQQP